MLVFICYSDIIKVSVEGSYFGDLFKSFGYIKLVALEFALNTSCTGLWSKSFDIKSK